MRTIRLPERAGPLLYAASLFLTGRLEAASISRAGVLLRDGIAAPFSGRPVPSHRVLAMFRMGLDGECNDQGSPTLKASMKLDCSPRWRGGVRSSVTPPTFLAPWRRALTPPRTGLQRRTCNEGRCWAGRESLQNGSRAGEKRNMNFLKSAHICSPMGAEKRNN